MRVTVFLVLLCTVAGAGCNSGSSFAPIGPPVRVAQVIAPQGIARDAVGIFIVKFEGFSKPFTVQYDFDGGVTELHATHTVNSDVQQYEYTDSLEVTFTGSAAKDITKMLTVSVADATGYTASGGTNFTVPASVELRQPSIVNVTIMDDVPQFGDPQPRALSVQLAGTPGLPAAVLVEAPLGVDVQPTGRNINFGADGTATATFDVLAVGLTGGTATLTVSVDGPLPLNGHDEAQLQVNIPALQLAPDTLYAIPLQTKVQVGDPVRIVVATGKLPHPFQYMTGVRITAPVLSGFDINYGGFNIGAPGGAVDAADGIWAQMGIEDGNFLSPDGWEFNAYPVDAGNDLVGLDWNVTPLGGRDLINASGELFNFEAFFREAGTWTLGFQQTNVVNRTYYQDGNQAPDYFWGDISNDHPGVPNSITVVQ